MQITLNTASGEFVTKVDIPDFLTIPNVIVWGDRVFQIEISSDKCYRETFFYVVPVVR